MNENMTDREVKLCLRLAICLKNAGLLDAELDAVDMVKQAQILLQELEKEKLDLILKP